MSDQRSLGDYMYDKYAWWNPYMDKGLQTYLQRILNKKLIQNNTEDITTAANHFALWADDMLPEWLNQKQNVY